MARRDQLLDATVQYILANGVGDLSLRPLAKAIGTKARLLIYHFGSREELIRAALTVALRRVQQQFVDAESDILEFWQWGMLPRNRAYIRLIFEVHGLAPRNPNLFGGYVREAIRSWKAIIVSRGHSETVATTIIAVFDGLLMDYLATGDRKRTTQALRQFLKPLIRPSATFSPQAGRRASNEGVGGPAKERVGGAPRLRSGRTREGSAAGLRSGRTARRPRSPR